MSREKTPEPCQTKLRLALLTEQGLPLALRPEPVRRCQISCFVGISSSQYRRSPQVRPPESWRQVQWQPLYQPQRPLIFSFGSSLFLRQGYLRLWSYRRRPPRSFSSSCSL